MCTTFVHICAGKTWQNCNEQTEKKLDGKTVQKFVLIQDIK